ncbi:MAG: hypothetical protein JWQ09_5117 [Segetibacter sp.]|nr:hypothetical protein [Segetibacter sp.]
MTIDTQILLSVTNFCIENLNIKTAKLDKEYFYASMPLCVVDSVFSISVNYKGVKNTIARICNYYKIPCFRKDLLTVPATDEQISTTDFLKLFTDMTPDALAAEVYRNKQRTSTRNGILKADAVIRFLKVLKDFNAEYFQDIPILINNFNFESSVKNIPGQGSGISLKYFFMLAGTDDLIKPDRQIISFLQNITGQKFNLQDCQTILFNVTGELNKQGYNLTPRLLDNIIWNYQRTT